MVSETSVDVEDTAEFQAEKHVEVIQLRKILCHNFELNYQLVSYLQVFIKMFL